MMTAFWKDSELDFIKMDAKCVTFDRIFDKARAERRPLSHLEYCEAVLLLDDQDELRRDWVKAVEREGGNTLWKPGTIIAGAEQHGDRLRVTNGAQRKTLWLYGEIGKQGVAADDVRNELARIPGGEDIEVRIHSEGGSYLESIAIHSMLSRRAGDVYVCIDGLAASGGSVIAMAGDTIEMASGAWMMIHEASGAMEGSADEFASAAERLHGVNNQLTEIYLTRWKGSKAELRQALAAETWFDAPKAIAWGLADSTSGQMAVAAHFSKDHKYRNQPAELAIAAKAQQGIHPDLAKAEMRLHRVLCLER